jgi:hypothetical protein
MTSWARLSISGISINGLPQNPHVYELRRNLTYVSMLSNFY